MEQAVYGSAGIGGLPQRNSHGPFLPGGKGIDLEGGRVGEGRKFHVQLQLALAAPDLRPAEAAAVFLFPVSVFVDIGDKSFIFRQSGHFLSEIF